MELSNKQPETVRGFLENAILVRINAVPYE
jgi:hypothetical protein